MSVANSFDAKTIDELQELGKLTGSEKTIISTGKESKKVSIDTIVGYAASMINNTPATISSGGVSGGGSIVFVPKGEEISIHERTPGTFYLEETNQISIRNKTNIPTSVVVSRSLGLRRV